MEAAKGSGWNDGERSELRDRRETALRACDDQIRFFQGAARRAHWLYAGSQVVTIVISPATTRSPVRRASPAAGRSSRALRR